MDRIEPAVGGPTLNPEFDGWWLRFFSGAHLDYHRHRWADKASTAREVAGLVRVSAPPQRARVLDAPSGNGRHSLLLASRGYRVTGVDSCQEFLDDARALAQRRGLQIEWVHQDMRRLQWRCRFDVAVCLGGSFGYFGDNGDLDFLRSCSSALIAGGKMVLDTASVETILPLHQERYWERSGRLTVLHRREFDLATSWVHTRMTVITDAGADERSYYQRLYTYRELREMFHQAGLASVQGYGSWNKDPFGPGSRRLIMVGERAI